MPSVPIVASGQSLTMSSDEIATLCETRHNQVAKTIERLLEQGVLRESRKTTRRVQPAGGGRPMDVYDLTKRDTLVVASGYNDELRARVIDRWIELETGTATQLPVSASLRETRQTFLEAARIAKIAGLTGNAAILSAAGATKRLLGTDPLEIIGRTHLPAPTNEGMINPTLIGKALGVSAHIVNVQLEACGYQNAFRDDKNKLAYQPTAKGVEAGGRLVDTGKKTGGRMVQQLLWPTSMIERMRAEAFSPA